MGHPDLLLADEPTGNLDSRSTEAILELLSELHADGATIIAITHDRELADGLPRRVAVRDGRIEHDSCVGSVVTAGHPRAVAPAPP